MSIKVSKRIFFRKSALQQYIRGRQKDVLPRLIAPTVVVFLWILLGIFLIVLIVVFVGFQRLFGV